MKWRAWPRRLRLGCAGLVTLLLACLLGPLLLPELAGHDAVRASLLPPGSQVTVVALRNGAFLVAPQVELSDTEVVVRHGVRTTRVARSAVSSIGQHRFWLGSDRFGRDLLRLLLLGGRLSLLIAGLGALVALVVGGSVGLAAASAGRLVDGLLMRLVDALLAFPILLLMILVSTLVRPGPGLLVVVLGLTSWMGLARLVRGQVLSLRSRSFVLAARTAGSPWYAIWGYHYLPGLVAPMAQDTVLRLVDLVVAEATLSFLGLGVPAETPTWGSIIAEGHTVLIDGWWLATFPGLAIAALVITIALIGDGLQELITATHHLRDDPTAAR